jgi:hypothetical protein
MGSGVGRSASPLGRSVSLPLWQVGLPFVWWVLDSVLSCLLQFLRVESLVVVDLLVWSV